MLRVCLRPPPSPFLHLESQGHQGPSLAPPPLGQVQDGVESTPTVSWESEGQGTKAWEKGRGGARHDARGREREREGGKRSTAG